MPRKRAPWVKQKRPERRKIEVTYAQPRIPVKAMPLYRFAGKEVTQIPRNEKERFLLGHKEITVRVVYLDRNMKGTLARHMELLPHAIELAEDAWINRITQLTAQALMERYRDTYTRNSVIPALKEYLEARAIPVNEETIRRAWTFHTSRTKKEPPMGTHLDLRNFEREYVNVAKATRLIRIGEATIAHDLIKEAFPGVKLTKAQSRAVHHWVQLNLGRHTGRTKQASGRLSGPSLPRDIVRDADVALKQKLAPEARTALLKAEQEDWTQLVNAVQRQFKETIKLDPSKLVAQRKSVKGRARELRIAQRQTEQAQQKFEQARFALESIRTEKGEDADFLQDLLDRKRISGDSIARLYTRGSLTRKIFRRAIQETRFVDEFGVREIDTLARGLAYIGPKGRVIQSARRALQSPRGRQIFDFLERHELIDTGHGGGDVVYLRRIKSSGE